MSASTVATLRHPGLLQYERLFGRKDAFGALYRPSLPDPLEYLIGRGLLAREAHGRWVALRCPVHKGGAEKNPSLRVSLIDGHFRCMACGASGGDLIALHRLITGLGFRDAVRDLGGRFHE